jgi:hypothetical protein
MSDQQRAPGAGRVSRKKFVPPEISAHAPLARVTRGFALSFVPAAGPDPGPPGSRAPNGRPRVP